MEQKKQIEIVEGLPTPLRTLTLLCYPKLKADNTQ